uniref:Uncharacterized protein n=1 Tax=Physcomitrium patens TaxID=3218 RepID=A0A2K1L0I5_PHYPA|nr:hypothetical protein PHYPA_002326 [Physcomitrium patens]
MLRQILQPTASVYIHYFGIFSSKPSVKSILHISMLAASLNTTVCPLILFPHVAMSFSKRCWRFPYRSSTLAH